MSDFKREGWNQVERYDRAIGQVQKAMPAFPRAPYYNFSIMSFHEHRFSGYPPTAPKPRWWLLGRVSQQGVEKYEAAVARYEKDKAEHDRSREKKRGAEDASDKESREKWEAEVARWNEDTEIMRTGLKNLKEARDELIESLLVEE